VSTQVPEQARAAVRELAVNCRQCLQCGQCRGACPNGFELDLGPRRVVRLILSQDVEKLLECEDVWRCSECQACTEACPMEVDVAGMMGAIRELQLEFGGVRCPERKVAEIATKRLSRKGKIDNMLFGTAMVSRGFIPSDLIATAEMGIRMSTGKVRRTPRLTVEGTEPKPFYAGCSLQQDKEAFNATAKVARDLGFPLAEQEGAGCCGHGSRGKVPAKLETDKSVFTVCPACDFSLQEVEIETVPVWQALVEHARREDLKLTAAKPRFVPYVGCLTDRETALGSLADAAGLAGAEMVTSYPALHAGCCGALGAMFRGPTEAVLNLIDFAAANEAPIVTPCLLCRDNVRSAVRSAKKKAHVYFWPEFFQAAKPAATTADGEADD
jgi:heterodisulfide reductase subunit C